MQRINLIILTAVLCLCASCTRTSDYAHLQSEIEQIISDKDATIGVAVIIDGIDTISVNGDRPFPMLSVYKLPIALALGDYAHTEAQIVPDSIAITKGDLLPDTYSPMRDRYAGIDTVKVHINELLAYSLQESDNNASDILLGLLPEVGYVTQYLQRGGFGDITVSSSEAEMHEDISLCYANTATPLAMASLLSHFDKDCDDAYSRTIKQLMETCTTGQNRLVKPLADTNIIVGHKTGTGFELPDGRLMAINDAGYVHLPNGRTYSIAIFIENSGYDMPTTEAIIAQISHAVYKSLPQ